MFWCKIHLKSPLRELGQANPFDCFLLLPFISNHLYVLFASHFFSYSLFAFSPHSLSAQMADSLSDMLKNFSLSTRETTNTVVKCTALQKPKAAIVMKLVMKKTVGVLELQEALKRIWKLTGSLRISTVGEGVYLLDFSEETEKEMVIHKQPWNFRRSVMVMGRVYGYERPAEIQLRYVPFWVQIHGLQIHAMTKAVGHEVGAVIGGVLEVDTDEDDVAWGQCLRIRVAIDVQLPICRCSLVTVLDESMAVAFRYERLSDFCFLCGMLDHVEKDCVEAIGRTEQWCVKNREFPAWLKADARNGIPERDMQMLKNLLERRTLNREGNRPIVHNRLPVMMTENEEVVGVNTRPRHTVVHNFTDLMHVSRNPLLYGQDVHNSRNHQVNPRRGLDLEPLALIVPDPRRGQVNGKEFAAAQLMSGAFDLNEGGAQKAKGKEIVPMEVTDSVHSNFVPCKKRAFAKEYDLMRSFWEPVHGWHEGLGGPSKKARSLVEPMDYEEEGHSPGMAEAEEVQSRRIE